MLGGILAALPLLKGGLGEQTFLFAGAGETGTGMADLLACAIAKATRLPVPEARKRIWLFDAQGLVTRARANELEDHKLPWAHPGPEGCTDLLSAVQALKPSCLIGIRRQAKSYAAASALRGRGATGSLFSPEVLSTMAAINERPLVFALSRPVGNSECTAEEAYAATQGRVIYASGCQQPPVTLPDGRVMRPLSSTSCYIFPGVGLGAMLCSAKHLRDDAFLAAAEALAARVTDADRAAGSVYPPFGTIREVSAHVARAVAAATYDAGLATRAPRPRDLLAEARAWMYDHHYRVYGNA
jgi:malate dehydrogenase (oxaloacetate-decarboxylating)(NADP+)